MWKLKRFKRQEFIPLIQFLIEMYEPDVYVEIGVQKGFTLRQIAPLVIRAIGVDINPVPTIEGAELFQMSSEEFAEEWKRMSMDGGDYIDLLFIDGDHKKESVLRDFDLLSPFVRPQTGLVLLHDTYPSAEHLVKEGYCFNAWEAAREIHKSKKYKDWEIVTLPGPFAGISICRNVTGGHLHWKRDGRQTSGKRTK